MKATNIHKKPGTADPVPHPLDRTDRAILKTLQRDASISNVALAEKVKLSAPACLRRVERLKQVGLIKDIVALLDNEALDAGMVVLIGVVLDRSTPESFAAFEAAAQKVSGCMECHVVTGSSTTSCCCAPRTATVSTGSTRSNCSTCPGFARFARSWACARSCRQPTSPLRHRSARHRPVEYAGSALTAYSAAHQGEYRG